MSTRLEEILEIVALAPNDPFPRYGLALEYKNSGQSDKALATFGELAEKHPEYVPQYLMHGNLLVALGDKEAAQRVFQAGIAVAERDRRAAHALSELRSALLGLSQPSDDEDE